MTIFSRWAVAGAVPWRSMGFACTSLGGRFLFCMGMALVQMIERGNPVSFPPAMWSTLCRASREPHPYQQSNHMSPVLGACASDVILLSSFFPRCQNPTTVHQGHYNNVVPFLPPRDLSPP